MQTSTAKRTGKQMQLVWPHGMPHRKQEVRTRADTPTASESEKGAETRDRTGDLQIFGLTLFQLSYRGNTKIAPNVANPHPRIHIHTQPRQRTHTTQHLNQTNAMLGPEHLWSGGYDVSLTR